MQHLTDILIKATRSIEPPYFKLHIAGGDPIYRERVYCYELYHQMRRRWPKGSAFFLNGEVDKAAHPILGQLGADRSKPDFLVHQPGSMQGNYAIIEVKSSNAESNDIRKDLQTLSLFSTRLAYKRAIFLLFGDMTDNELIRKIDRLSAGIPNLALVEVWLHAAPRSPARHVCLLSPLNQQGMLNL
ncbi:MAG: methionyl-tRNA formyltransferase-like protein [Rhodomicrobium sp.]